MNRQNHSHSTLDFAGLTDWFPVFRAGEQTDSKGRKRTFTEADLDTIVANHSADDPAPLVVGHPKHNDPAYGWTGGLKREGDTLFAKAQDVVAEFEEAVKKKLYRNRSISITPEGDGWKLRHIGFLGAKPPAVAGLGDIAFSDDQDVMEFAIDEARLGRRAGWGFDSVARMMRKVREFLIDKHDLETADRVLPSWDIDSVAEIGRDLTQPIQAPSSYSIPDDDTGDTAVPGEKSFTQADIDAAVQAALAGERTKAEKLERERRFTQRKTEAEATITTLVGEGRLLPAQVPGLAEFIANLPEADDAAFEFSVSDGKTEKKSPAAFMAEFLSAIGKQIELGPDGTSPPDDPTRPASDYHGHTVSPERAALDLKARNYMKQHNVDYVTAVLAVEEK